MLRACSLLLILKPPPEWTLLSTDVWSFSHVAGCAQSKPDHHPNHRVWLLRLTISFCFCCRVFNKHQLRWFVHWFLSSALRVKKPIVGYNKNAKLVAFPSIVTWEFKRPCPLFLKISHVRKGYSSILSQGRGGGGGAKRAGRASGVRKGNSRHINTAARPSNWLRLGGRREGGRADGERVARKDNFARAHMHSLANGGLRKGQMGKSSITLLFITLVTAMAGIQTAEVRLNLKLILSKWCFSQSYFTPLCGAPSSKQIVLAPMITQKYSFFHFR